MEDSKEMDALLGEVSETTKPNDNSNNSGSSSGGGSGGFITSIVNAFTNYSKSNNVSLSGSVNNTKIINELKALKDTKKPTIKVKNASYILKKTLKELVNINKDVVLYADTTYQHNNNVQGRMYITQTNILHDDDKLYFGVWTEESKTSKVKTKFNKWYDNKVSIVYIEHEGSLGFNTPIAAKVDLSNLDVENLMFYVYDKKSNSVKQLEDSSYRIDGNGYLRFKVDEGGYIIVTDKTLNKR